VSRYGALIPGEALASDGCKPFRSRDHVQVAAKPLFETTLDDASGGARERPRYLVHPKPATLVP